MSYRFFCHVTSWSDHMTTGLGALSGRSAGEKESRTDVPESRHRPHQATYNSCSRQRAEICTRV